MPTFNSPPNWPTPPNGWTPPPGWEPDPSWGPLPHGWQLWLPDQAPAKRSWFSRHKILTGLGALIVIIVVATSLNSGGDSQPTSTGPAAGSPTSTKSTESKSPAATTPKANASSAPSSAAAADVPSSASAGLNDTVRDGSLTFKVTKVSCGHSQVGDQYLNKKAQGQFCIISMTVKNVGDDATLFSDDNQRLTNAKGQSFDADSEAGIYLGEDSNAFLEQINPGNTVNGKIVFDIPKGAKPETIQLHDNRLFSGGVDVDLS